jgi:hypothetical protein
MCRAMLMVLLLVLHLAIVCHNSAVIHTAEVAKYYVCYITEYFRLRGYNPIYKSLRQ